VGTRVKLRYSDPKFYRAIFNICWGAKSLNSRHTSRDSQGLYSLESVY